MQQEIPHVDTDRGPEVSPAPWPAGFAGSRWPYRLDGQGIADPGRLAAGARRRPWPLSGAGAGGPARPTSRGRRGGGFAFSHPGASPPTRPWRPGVTTLVAALGTDSLTRTLAQVLAGKVREFRAARGERLHMYTGSTTCRSRPSPIGGVGHHADPRGAGVGRWPSATTDPAPPP